MSPPNHAGLLTRPQFLLQPHLLPRPLEPWLPPQPSPQSRWCWGFTKIKYISTWYMVNAQAMGNFVSEIVTAIPPL